MAVFLVSFCAVLSVCLVPTLLFISNRAAFHRLLNVYHGIRQMISQSAMNSV